MLPTAKILLLALAIDAAVGDPVPLYRRLPHPVALIGRGIAWLDRRLNRDDWSSGKRRLTGVCACLLLIVAGALLGVGVERLLARIAFGWAILAALISLLLAQNSLYRHVARVAEALAQQGLAGGRRAVAEIVGRDPESLDEAGICRAALESLAENFSDGVVAPVFWALLLGLPGILVYKAVNTADSMIGHRTPRHLAFGWAAARCDDLLNLIPARLAGLLIAGAAGLLPGAKPRAALAAMLRDAGKHRSPNAGWPEAAQAGALGLALAGPRRYGGEIVEDHWMNDGGRAAAAPEDIRRGLRLYFRACLLQAALVALLALA